MKIFALKVALAYWIIFIVCLYSIVKYGFKGVDGRIFRAFAAICYLFCIFVTGYMTYFITIDVIKYDYQTATIVVKEVDNNPGPKGGLFYSDIYTGEKEPYSNAYKKFRFTDGETYEIKYLPRTRTIIDSRLKE
ncbi:MAG: hypothetical protein PHE66_05495 [Syntrophaceticus schinkii]|jgi:hypothetical protein|nr:hypothetical protein [Syntrophaceticus schinkii]